MNRRSIRFRLTAWYSVLVLLMLTAFCGAVYIGLGRYLTATLSDQLARQAVQIDHTWLEQINESGPEYVVNEIDEHLSPEITDHFIRVTTGDGSVLYQSRLPRDQSFDPSSIGPAITAGSAGYREEHSDGKALLIYSLPVSVPRSGTFLIEVGAPYDHIESTLHGLALVFAIILPLALVLALAVGYLLMKRALQPVDQLARAAESITSRNLGERLPIPGTGDEIERLSATLNGMIARLEASFRQMNQFTADASHDLRTPLTVLRGELEVALRRNEINPAGREVIGSVLEETEKLSKTVESLMVLSRLDSGEMQPDRTRFDLAKLCLETVEQMGLLAEDKGLEIQCSSSENIEVAADLLRIRQILINLVDNAIKYTPEGGKIGVRVFRNNGCAIIEVADTGHGIPAEALPLIFNRFYRVDKARSRETGGSGLGLAIAKSICELHGGHISVESSVGTGSRFRVEIPLELS